MNSIPFDSHMACALIVASAIARSEGVDCLDGGVLVAGILEAGNSVGTFALTSAGASVVSMRRAMHYMAVVPVRQAVDAYGHVPPLPFGDEGARIIKSATRIARRDGCNVVGTQHVLRSICHADGTRGQSFLEAFEINPTIYTKHAKLVDAAVSDGILQPGPALIAHEPPVGASHRTTDVNLPAVVGRLGWSVFGAGVAVGSFALLAWGWVSLLRGIPWDVTTLEGFSWVSGLALYVALAGMLLVVLRLRSIVEFLRPSTLRYVREEFFDGDSPLDSMSSSPRANETAAAQVIHSARAITRWLRRVMLSVVVVGAVSGYWLWRTGWQLPLGICLGVTIGATLALHWLTRRTLVVGPGVFTYPIRSRRIVPRVTNAVHEGLSGFAYFVTMIPTVAVVGGLAWSAMGPDAESLVPQWVLHIAAVLSGVPLTAAVMLFAVPVLLTVLIYRFTVRLTAVDERDLGIEDDTPPVLYLRTWETDEVRVRANSSRNRFLDEISPARRVRFSELLSHELSTLGPVLQIGQPGTQRHLGVGSVWSDDDMWRDVVQGIASRAAVTVFAASTVVEESGFFWEMTTLGDGAVTGRLAIVFPPDFDLERALAPGGFLQVAHRQFLFRELANADITKFTRIAIRGHDGTWNAMDGTDSDASTYSFCLSQLRIDYGTEWEFGAAGNFSDTSPVAVERLSSMMLGALFGPVPSLAPKVIAGLYGVYYWSRKLASS